MQFVTKPVFMPYFGHKIGIFFHRSTKEMQHLHMFSNFLNGWGYFVEIKKYLMKWCIASMLEDFENILPIESMNSIVSFLNTLDVKSRKISTHFW